MMLLDSLLGILNSSPHGRAAAGVVPFDGNASGPTSRGISKVKTGPSLASALIAGDPGRVRVFKSRQALESELLHYHFRCLSLSAPIDGQALTLLGRFAAKYTPSDDMNNKNPEEGQQQQLPRVIMSRHANVVYRIWGATTSLPAADERAAFLAQCFPSDVSQSLLVVPSGGSCDLVHFVESAAEATSPSSLFILPVPTLSNATFVAEVDLIDLEVKRVWGVHFGSWRPSGDEASTGNNVSADVVLNALWSMSVAGMSCKATEITKGAQMRAYEVVGSVEAEGHAAVSRGVSAGFIAAPSSGRDSSYILNSCVQSVDTEFGHHCCTLRTALVFDLSKAGSETVAGVSHLDVYEHGSDYQALEFKDAFRMHKAAHLQLRPLFSEEVGQREGGLCVAARFWVQSLEAGLIASLAPFAESWFDGLRRSLPVSMKHIDFLTMAEISVGGTSTTGGAGGAAGGSRLATSSMSAVPSREGILKELAAIKARRDFDISAATTNRSPTADDL